MKQSLKSLFEKMSSDAKTFILMGVLLMFIAPVMIVGAYYFGRSSVEDDPYSHVIGRSYVDGNTIYYTDYSLGCREESWLLVLVNPDGYPVNSSCWTLPRDGHGGLVIRMSANKVVRVKQDDVILDSDFNQERFVKRVTKEDKIAW